MGHKADELSLQVYAAKPLKDALESAVLEMKQRKRTGVTRQEMSNKGVVNALVADFLTWPVERREEFLARWIPAYKQRYYQPTGHDDAAEVKADTLKPKSKPRTKGKTG